MFQANTSRGSGRATMRRNRRKGGFTLVEVSLAMVVLVVALVSVSAATLRSHSLQRSNRERTLANNALRSIAERIHSLSYTTVEVSPDTWVQEIVNTYGPGGTVGNTFVVNGLNPVAGAAIVGTIQIITDETETDAALGTELGLPRDLNGDLDANDVDVSGDARILPVLVSITYRSGLGTTTISHSFFAVGF